MLYERRLSDLNSSLGDSISLYLNQIDLIEAIARKNSDLKVTIIELEGLIAERDFLNLYLTTTIEERNKLREDLERAKQDLQGKDEKLKEMERKLDLRQIEIWGLKGKLEANDATLKLYRPLVGERLKEIMDRTSEKPKENEVSKEKKPAGKPHG